MKRPLFVLFCLTALCIFLWYPREYRPDPIFPQGDYYDVTAEGEILTYARQKESLSLMLGDCLISFNGQVLHCERLLVSVTEDTHIRTAVSGTDDHSPSRADEAVFVNHPFHAGNRVSVAGSLSSFQPARNPGNFDWRLYYLSRHISYRVYADTITLTDNRRNLLSDGTLRLRQYLESRLDSMNFGSSDTAATLKALLLGDKTALEEETKAKYEDGGILHILSVSGLHVSLLGGAILLLGRFLYLPARLRGIFASLLIFLYWQLCGSGLSAGRAAIMFACLSAAPLFGRTYDSLSAMSLAGLFFLLDSPLMLFQSGFQLSFGAILGIQLVCPAFEPPEEIPCRKFLSALAFGLGIQLALLPITLYHFFRYPLYGILLNLIVLPLTAPLFICGTLGLIAALLHPGLGSLLALPCRLILGLYDILCRAAISLPGASVVLGRPSMSRILLYYIGLTLFCLWRKQICLQRSKSPESSLCQSNHTTVSTLPDSHGKHMPCKSISRQMIWALPPLLLVILLAPLPQKSLHVTFLDVGQGDCAFLLTPKRTSILIDGGSSDLSMLTEQRLIPFLESQGIDSLDYVFLSHSDDDHVNAVAGWLKAGYSIGTMILPKLNETLASETSYQKLQVLAGDHQIPLLYFEEGQTWREGKLSILCLAPRDIRYSSINAASMVLLAEYRDIRLLFTGDCEKDGEAALLQTLAERQLTCHILKAGHHGSSAATGEELLRQLKPQFVIISSGIRNRYGHPHPDMLRRLESQEIPYYVTAACGAVTVTIQKNQARVHTMITPGKILYRKNS